MARDLKHDVLKQFFFDLKLFLFVLKHLLTIIM